MIQCFSNFGLPLLGKELIEQAARKRTYVIRVLYASLFFFASCLFFYKTLQAAYASPLAVLGTGREMFTTLVNLQFAGVYLFMPAMTSGTLTQEKERASLQLLFLTRLGPWTILLEKLLSRLVPMLGFLLLSLPLLAFAYSLGGISTRQLWSGVWMLVISAVQMGTLALMCSAYCRTTVGSLRASYLLGLLMLFGPLLMCLILESCGSLVSAWGDTMEAYGVIECFPVTIFPFFAPASVSIDGMATRGGVRYWPIVAHSALILSASAICFVLARVFIVRRAFLLPRSVTSDVTKVIDTLFQRLNRKLVTNDNVLIGDSDTLPHDEPVAWRETTKRSLCKTRNLLGVFIAIEVPVAVFCSFVAFNRDGFTSNSPSLLLFLMWIAAVLIVSAESASLIAGERSHQSLDVLCATPLSGNEIIRQKYRAVRRLIGVLTIPFFTVFYFVCAARWRLPSGNRGLPGGRNFILPLYVACSVLSVVIYLPMVAWLSFLIGLKVRTQARAIMGSMGTIVGWCVGPIIFVVLPLSILFPATGTPNLQEPLMVQLAMLLSPATIVISNEQTFQHEFAGFPWLAVILNFVGYGLALISIRYLCLKYVDRLLGRVECMHLNVIDEGPTIAQSRS